MDKKKPMLFWRIFKYVWPQWPRLIAIVCTSFIIAILFSLSFATIMPLLKVMMGEEGLHGWIDRKTCDARYGMDFYVPDNIDLSDNVEIRSYLQIDEVKEKSLAEIAGLKVGDRIIAVGQTDTEAKTPAAKLLENLAVIKDCDVINIKYRRSDAQGRYSQQATAALKTFLQEPPYFYDTKVGAIELVQRAISFMPRDQERENKKRGVIFIILVMGVVTTARCVARFVQTYLAEKVVQVSLVHLREETFDHVLDMPVGFFSTEGTSDTTSRLLGDVSSVGNGVKVLLGKTLREPLKAMGILAVAMGISVKLTLIFLSMAPVTIFLLGLLGKRIKKATKRSLVSNALLLGKVQGVVSALHVVKVYNRQEHENESYGVINQRFLRQILKVAKVEAATGPIMEVLGMIAGSAALLVGVQWVLGESRSMDPSAFFTLLVLLGTAAESIRKVSDVWNKVQSANAAAERVYEVIDYPVEDMKPDAPELGDLKDKIEFRDIFFTYPGSESPTLRDVTLTVNAGETVAVVGPNGSGKTTLVNLIPRFYEVDSGHIFIDGMDTRQCSLKSLRGQIGMVTQRVVTFNDTIAANISYGCPGATMDEIIDAAKRSFCHEFIDPLPKGYDTMIGENSAGFSGGQLQRIVIARAVLKDPAILIFDEAMSQVDAHSESRIHEALSELVRDRTCFVIAHRFSTVISADRIVVMEGGRIVAAGKHEQLLKECRLYQRLYETQLSAPVPEGK